MKIIHISDLHLQSKGYHIQNISRLFESITKKYPACPVVITGDLTDSCTKPQLRAVAYWLDLLMDKNPVMAVPGNHDYAWKGNIHRPNGRENWRDIVEAKLGYSLREGFHVKHLPGLRFVLIDSGDPKDKVASARGYISDRLMGKVRQFIWEDSKLKTLYLTVVILHHHPFTKGFFDSLVGAENFLEAIKGWCDILLFGHNHHLGIWWKWQRSPWKEVELIVASHKSTQPISGNVLGYIVIEVDKDGPVDLKMELVY